MSAPPIGCRLAAAVLLIALAESAAGAQFRRLDPIPGPADAPAGYETAVDVAPVPRRAIERGVQELMAAWNTAALDDKLSPTFQDRQRLLDAIAINVPRDARIRVLAVQGASTLGQFVRTDVDGTREVISVVSAIVRTQIEFDDPVRGFQRLEGIADYVFDVRHRAPER